MLHKTSKETKLFVTISCLKKQIERTFMLINVLLIWRVIMN